MPCRTPSAVTSFPLGILSSRGRENPRGAERRQDAETHIDISQTVIQCQELLLACLPITVARPLTGYDAERVSQRKVCEAAGSLTLGDLQQFCFGQGNGSGVAHLD